MNTSGGSFFSSATANPNFDNLLLQSLMSRLQLRPPNLQSLPPFPAAAKSLEDLLLSDLLLNLSESDSDNDHSSSSKTQLSKEESKLEKDIVRTILAGEIEKLKPNSGQAITIGEHHICVGFQEEPGFDYRVWEWHGHIMLFDEENGYTPEYIYGNYFERIGGAKRKMKNDSNKKASGGDDDEKEKEVDSVGNIGLKELIESGDSSGGRILHRNINANSGSSSDAWVPSEMACLASSPGNTSLTAVWISRDVILGFLLYCSRRDDLVASFSKMLLMKLFMIPMALLESGCTCFRTLNSFGECFFSPLGAIFGMEFRCDMIWNTGRVYIEKEV